MVNGMKKSLFILSTLMLLASCANRENLSWQPEPMRFSASAAGTRTVFEKQGSGLAVTWSPDDTIGIWCSATTRGNYPYTAAVDRTDKRSASFNVVSEETMFLYDGTPCNYYAYYPWRGGFSATPVVTFQVPSVQSQTAEGDVSHLAAQTLFRAAPVAVSANSAQADFHFTPALATVRLALKMAPGSIINVPVRRVKLLSGGAPLAASSATLDLSDPASVPVTSTGEQEVSLGFATLPVLDPDHEADVWLTVLPASHAAALTAEVMAIDGSVATVSLPAVNFGAGKLYSRSLEFNVADFVQKEPFDIQATTLTVNAGEAVTFTISGSAAGIGFYSGEKFHDYAYSDHDRIEVSSLKISFKHAIAAGAQNNHPYVKVSSDYNGKMTETDILAATWKDISDHFTFATENLGSDNPITSSLANYEKYFVDSGEYDLSSEFAAADSLYVAMFWHADKYDATLLNTRTVSYVTRFRVGDWEMSPTGLTFVWDADKWDGVSASNTPQWQTPKTSNGVPDYPAFRFMSDFRPTADRDAYAVANEAFKPAKQNYGPDSPETVQSAVEDTPATWSYTYTEPGTYQAVFVASCPTLSGDKTETRIFTITVQ